VVQHLLVPHVTTWCPRFVWAVPLHGAIQHTKTDIHVNGEVRIRNHSVLLPTPYRHTHALTHNLRSVDVSEPESAVRGGLGEFMMWTFRTARPMC
jgi:hypothetical protein